MKIVRHGNPKGLDIDYKVFVHSVEEVHELHKHLLEKGYTFLYQKGDIPFTPNTDKLIVLHYIDKSLKLYDYAFIFPETSKHTEQRLKSEFDIELDKAYARAKTDRTFHHRLMDYMKFHILLQAFWKHMKAYGTLGVPYQTLLHKVLIKIDRETGLRLESTVSIESLRKLDRAIKQFFEV